MTHAEYKKKEKEKLANQKLKPLQKISNNFIDNTIAKNNLSALKTIFYLASILRDMSLSDYKDDELIDITIDTKQMYEYTEMSPDLVRRNLKVMQETSITFINEKEKWEIGMNLLPMYEIQYGKRKVKLKLFTKIARLIIDVKNNYTFMNTKELMLLSNKHSIRLLALLNKLANYDNDIPKRKYMTLLELNEFFGTKYKTWGEIERRIFVPVKEELDNNSKLSFIYESNFQNLGQGRPSFRDVVIDVIQKNIVQGKLI